MVAVLGVCGSFGLGCGSRQAEDRAVVSVLAASSLGPAFADVIASFEETSGGRVVAGYGASSQLRLQIEQGLRADVYAAADEENMEMLRFTGLLAAEPITFATNRLVVATSGRTQPPLTAIPDLARPGLRLASAEPSVPIGAYALQSLDAMARSGVFGPDFRERVQRNVVTREANVRQIVAKVELGEVDAAIVYASDAVASPGIIAIEIPADFNVTTRYTVAILRDAPHAAMAQRFVNHLGGHQAQRALERWGFQRAR